MRDSDGTVIFSLAPTLTGGSKKTVAFAIKHKKPWIHIHRDGQYDAADLLLRFISEHRITVLNVAGSRASNEPDIAAFVNNVLEEAFFPRPGSWLGGKSYCMNTKEILAGLGGLLILQRSCSRA